MTPENKPIRKRRVNRKRQILKTARQSNPDSRMWAVCLDTVQDYWKAFVIDCSTKKILCCGEIVEGRNNSYKSLGEALDKAFENK